jgi:peptide chain release factor 3
MQKQFLKGLAELLEEGAVQLLRDRNDDGNGLPILAAVGQLQFEVRDCLTLHLTSSHFVFWKVVEYRLKAEYGVESTLEPLGYTIAR